MAAISSSYASPAFSASVKRETTFFVLLLLAGMHTAVSIIPEGQVLVPYAMSFVAALGILSIHVRQIDRAVFNWFVLLACIIVTLALCTGAVDGNFAGHFKSSSQLVYSVAIGYALFVGLGVMGRQRVENTFFWVTVFLIVGAVLEVYGPLKPVSDWFRNTFNAWEGDYEATSRDIIQYGAYRPKFFSSEPSLLGFSTGMAMCLWLAAKKSFTATEIITAILFFGLAFFLVRSPNLLWGPLAFVLVALWSGRNRNRIQSWLGKFCVISYLVAIATYPFLSLYLRFTMRNLPNYMQGFSYFVRIEAPPLMAIDVLRSHPFFGIGLGDKDQMRDLAIATFNNTGLIAAITPKTAIDLGIIISNASWQWWIYFGLAGGLFLVFFISRFFKILRVPVSGYAVIGITAGTFLQGISGVSAPLAWVAVFVVAAICKLRSKGFAT
jgi:hypothetical protein